MTDFCYDVYDINGDKSLAREELQTCLKGGLLPYDGVIGGEELEEGIREIVEIGMRKLDQDKDGQITQTDFKNACLLDPLLLQSIGPCLPPAKAICAFLAIFTENYRNVSTEYNGELTLVYNLMSEKKYWSSSDFSLIPLRRPMEGSTTSVSSTTFRTLRSSLSSWTPSWTSSWSWSFREYYFVH
jgi:hypothetical protein